VRKIERRLRQLITDRALSKAKVDVAQTTAPMAAIERNLIVSIADTHLGGTV
jgi:hypothetical protein